MRVIGCASQSVDVSYESESMGERVSVSESELNLTRGLYPLCTSARSWRLLPW